MSLELNSQLSLQLREFEDTQNDCEEIPKRVFDFYRNYSPAWDLVIKGNGTLSPVNEGHYQSVIVNTNLLFQDLCHSKSTYIESEDIDQFNRRYIYMASGKSIEIVVQYRGKIIYVTSVKLERIISLLQTGYLPSKYDNSRTRDGIEKDDSTDADVTFVDATFTIEQARCSPTQIIQKTQSTKSTKMNLSNADTYSSFDIQKGRHVSTTQSLKRKLSNSSSTISFDIYAMFTDTTLKKQIFQPLAASTFTSSSTIPPIHYDSVARDVFQYTADDEDIESKADSFTTSTSSSDRISGRNVKLVRDSVAEMFKKKKIDMEILFGHGDSIGVPPIVYVKLGIWDVFMQNEQ
ncbi:unnamed protein product [Caenorhabditis angaria]|uniref:Uncharacterized protein n=1 Tax=Caenorhabditis angaria TaxID=860376 RepID=A0A9P1IY62_9PELO|nr:unnamed protein product [Caenorhabditis angaria]